MILEFVIPGEPNGQGRPRFTTFGGHVKAYDPAKSRNYKAFVSLLANEAVQSSEWKCTELPICLTVNAYMSIPASKPKKFKEGAILGLIRPTKKPDADNIYKGIADALTGIAYKDDKQVVRSIVTKYYAAEPRVEVSISEAVSD